MLVEAGHDVFLLDNNAEELEHTLTVHLPRAASKDKGRYAGTYCDISDASSVKSALRKARQHHRDGKIDVLINNAGRARPFWQSVESIASDLDTCDPLLDDKQPAEDDPVIREWRSFIDTNLSGAFIVTRMALGMLHRTGKMAAEQDLQPSPSIIHISSSRAKQSEPNQEPYAST
jgi:NAD(P)-dependent dehydrogenase (short-subunit alcohol dehydrogenase family)